MHGLFAPVHKISRAGGSATSTPSPHSRPLMSTSLRASRERSGSQESVSSLSSTASSVSRSRVRLGVTSLANQVHAAIFLILLYSVTVVSEFRLVCEGFVSFYIMLFVHFYFLFESLCHSWVKLSLCLFIIFFILHLIFFFLFLFTSHV